MPPLIDAELSKLTTHVLDTAHGRPASGIVIMLLRIEKARTALGTFVTNLDGRCAAPLLMGAAFQPGIYELDFAVGDYFANLGIALEQPRFLDVITLRFGINDRLAHYHVPLLVSPFSYSTYRGS